jgi:hypothetical protein
VGFVGVVCGGGGGVVCCVWWWFILCVWCLVVLLWFVFVGFVCVGVCGVLVLEFGLWLFV